MIVFYISWLCLYIMIFLKYVMIVFMFNIQTRYYTTAHTTYNVNNTYAYHKQPGRCTPKET